MKQVALSITVAAIVAAIITHALAWYHVAGPQSCANLELKTIQVHGFLLRGTTADGTVADASDGEEPGLTWLVHRSPITLTMENVGEAFL